jgi:plastocyanin
MPEQNPTATPNNNPQPPAAPEVPKEDDLMQPEDVSFQVMPQDGSTPVQNDEPKTYKPEAVSQPMPVEHEIHGLNHRVTYIAISILLVAVLGALAYFLLWSKPENTNVNNNAQANLLPKIFLQQYFNVEVCEDLSRCGDNADPDNDGLINYDEWKVRAGTDPNDPDSDGDGLADGDEFHIYKTEPAFRFSYCRDDGSLACQYDDGSQVANDYEPSTPGNKMDETQKAALNARIEQFKLHDPTPATLNSKRTSPATTPQSNQQNQTHTVFIENGKFDPNTLSVNKNDTVVWLNKDTATHVIASDPHPAHTALPGLESNNLSSNQTFSFKFTESGSFKYHDHLYPNIKGTIIVK